MEVPISKTLPSAQNDSNHTEDAEQDGHDQNGLRKACRAQGAGPRVGDPSRRHGMGSSGDRRFLQRLPVELYRRVAIHSGGECGRMEEMKLSALRWAGKQCKINTVDLNLF